MELGRSFEGPPLFEPLAEEKQGDGDDQDANGNRRAERPIIRRAKEALYDVGDHRAGSAADEERREEIAQREYEGEGCAGEQPGNGKRQDDAEKCLNRSGAEVVRGFDKRAGDVFECRIDGKKNERGVDVREHENDGERAVEKERNGLMGEMQVLQEAIENAFAAENGFPGVTAHQVTHPQRNDDELVEQLFASAGKI